VRRRDLLARAAPPGELGLAAGSHQAADAVPAGNGFRLFYLRKFAAAGDGESLDSRAINAAIDARNSADGELAYFPA
jgi:polygalacturonase